MKYREVTQLGITQIAGGGLIVTESRQSGSKNLLEFCVGGERKRRI
jgi:hypothetical protein